MSSKRNINWDYYYSKNYWSTNDRADFTECARCGSKKQQSRGTKRQFKDNCCPHCYSFYRTELDQAMRLLGKSRVEVTKMLEEVHE